LSSRCTAVSCFRSLTHPPPVSAPCGSALIQPLGSPTVERQSSIHPIIARTSLQSYNLLLQRLAESLPKPRRIMILGRLTPARWPRVSTQRLQPLTPVGPVTCSLALPDVASDGTRRAPRLSRQPAGLAQYLRQVSKAYAMVKEFPRRAAAKVAEVGELSL